MTPRSRSAGLLLATTVLAALTLAGCSSGSDGTDSAGSSSADTGAVGLPSTAEGLADRDSAAGSAAQDTAQDTAQDAAQEDVGEDVDPADGFARSVVRTGDLSMRAKDVRQARYDVQRITDRYRGEVTEESTESDEDGAPAYARMVLRVPSEDFDDAVEALSEVGERPTVSTTADDVTTRLIDLRTRVATQRRSIARITVLFEQARTIRDIMAIESELSRRQADLEALERKRAYLAGQAAMSTITVGIERAPGAKAVPAEKDGDGFRAGLTAGWDALRDFGTGVATVLGALLPWLVVLAVLGVPAWVLARPLRRRRARRPAPEPEGLS